MRMSKEQYMMAVAELTASMSTCNRTKVGAVLTDTNMEQIWVGYNGGPRGGANECRHPENPGSCGCVHAEANAVVKAPGGVEKVAFLTMSPCVTCAVMLVNAHVERVYFKDAYRDTEGLEVLRESFVRFESTRQSRRALLHESGGWMPR